ncbi:MAG: UDP-glucose 4-epimerase GalE [Armatimonadetes bacterium]|nr:UDP-glucose 4-epimerase GalE [Armatimonadota bacterium]
MLRRMILVVGGAGFVGSHICKSLRAQNIEHLVFDNLEKGHSQAIVGSQLAVGDIRDPATLERVFADNDIDTVMHFAAYIEVGESVTDPAKYYRNNFQGVLNLMDAMRNHRVEQFVFSSTAAVYGEPKYVPIDELHPKDPTSPYGETKWNVERMIQSFGRAYGLRSVALRYFNAAGASPDGSIGEDHDPETHLIARALLAAMGKVPPLTIFGTDYDTPDGTCLRDYVHVLDLAQAHILAIKHLRSGGESRQFNLGYGNGFSVRQVINAVEKVTGMEVPKSEGPRREGDPARLIASSTKIREELGWNPEFNDLETIVSHAWKWRQAFPNGYGL